MSLVSANCFADTDTSILAPNTVAPSACVYENMGVYEGGFVMVPVYEDAVYECQPGQYLPKDSEACVTCLANSYCPGGQYTYSETEDTGIFDCPSGTYAPAGMSSESQCGRILRVGETQMYLATEKTTSPSLCFDLDKDGTADMFANMTTQDVTMSKDTDQKLKVRLDGTVYSVYDTSFDVTSNE